MIQRTCVLCGAEVIVEGDRTSCERCGIYSFYPPLRNAISALGDLHLISGYAREQTELRDRIVILNVTEDCELVKQQAPRTIPDKAMKLLKHLSKRSQHFGFDVELKDSDYTLGYCKNTDELLALLEFCVDRRWLKLSSRSEFPAAFQVGLSFKVTADGFEQLDHRKRANLESEKVFVAMWFADDLASTYNEGIKPALEDVGYRPIRIDQEEFNGDIIDRMLAEIRECRFVVADFTGHRHGVYFEAGFALGLGLPVVWLCRDDEVAKAHFDTEHFSHVLWKTPEQLKTRLANRVRASIGTGPLTKPK